MPIETNLNVAPYHDDYDERKDYYRIPFKPSVSVQTRELNQIQSMGHRQFERMADNVFKRGTIVEGCNFVYKDTYPYAKLVDTETDGTSVVPGSYVGFFARNDSGVTGFIHDYQDGYESSAPDLKTIYVRYTSSGPLGNAYSFSPDEVLTIYDANSSLFKVRVDNGGLSFSNTDRVVITPALVVNVSTGTFTNAEYVSQPSVGSNLQIIWIDDTTLALQGQVILGVRPRGADLANSAVTSTAWSVSNGAAIINAGNTVTGTVEAVLGSGAEGGVVTDGAGKILRVILTDRGFGYSNAPHVSVRSANNAGGLAALSLAGLNYRARVSTAASSNAIGNGYAFGVTEGTIYQKGYMLRVEPQNVIVSKYDQVPNGVVVGFKSYESIVDSNRDPTLNDPLVGENYNAPGADRLKIDVRLEVADRASIRPEDSFFPIVEWSEGQPAKTSQATEYSRLGDEMARRTKEAEGDFVIDRFNVTTRSPLNQEDEGSVISVVVDPGLGYVSGYRVETQRNYVVSIDKGTDSRIDENQVISLAYGSYVRVSEVAGTFQFSTGDVVSLRDTARLAITSSVLTAPGAEIGQARIRSLVYESGVPGTPTAVYRAYLFAVSMNPGKNFRSVRSLFYDGTNKGAADAVLELDPTTELPVAALAASVSDGLLFPSGVSSLKNANGITYVYRTVSQVESIANTGLAVRSLASNPGEFFRYVGALTDDEMQDLTVVPLGNLRANASLTGTVSVNTTSPNMIGTSTTFIADLEAGDYVYLSGNSTQNTVGRVQSVVNNTLVILSSNGGIANSAAVVRRTFPAGVPVPFGRRAGLSANVDANGNVLTLNFGGPFNHAAVNTAISHDVERRSVSVETKSALRNRLVRISLANSSGGTTGPWCLGIPDAFRLRAVYVGSNSDVSSSDLAAVDDFLIDSNQTVDYLDLSWLVKKTSSSLTLSSGDWLLVELDHFSASGPGVYATPSYVSANSEQIDAVDSLPLANLGTSISSLEIPSTRSASGRVLDLTTYLDFRPIVANTAVSTTNAAASTINPAETVSFGNTADPANDKKFPLPGSQMVVTIEQYLGRKDSVIIGVDGNVTVLRGNPDAVPTKRYAPSKPNDALLLDVIDVPPYPTIPVNWSTSLEEILNTRLINETSDIARSRARTALPSSSRGDLNLQQPSRYTQRDVGSIDRRLRSVEYYTALTLLETNLKDKVIPSSVDGATDRFKFGFFVDDFSTWKFQETSNPNYAAGIEDDRLVPQRETWTVIQDPGEWMMPPYVDHLIVNQDYATSGPISSNGASNNGCVFDGVSTNTIFKTSAGFDDITKAHLDNKKFIITAGSTSGPMVVYFDAGYGGIMSVDIYRGNTIFKTSNTAVSLSNTEKTDLQNHSGEFGGWFAQLPLHPLAQFDDGFFYSGAGKISWTHDPSLGKTYTIKVSRHSSSFLEGWRMAAKYPIDTTTATCGEPPSPTPVPATYEGTMEMVAGEQVGTKGRGGELSLLFTYGIPVGGGGFMIGGITEPYTYVEILCRGLKPSTLHAMDFGAQSVSHDLPYDQPYLDPGASMVADARGMLRFKVYFPAKRKTLLSFFAPQYGSIKIRATVTAPGSSATGSWEINYRETFDVLADLYAQDDWRR